MLPSEKANGTHTAPGPEVNGQHYRNGATVGVLNGKKESRLNGVPQAPSPSGEAPSHESRRTMALFCYHSEGRVGEFITELADALVRRRIDVHIFTPCGFGMSVAGVSMHVVGESDAAELLDQVEQFTHRAVNAFLKQFPVGTAPVGLMGFEWSSAQVLSILRGIRRLDAILSLHSVERQRSDVTGELGQRIETIELNGVREASAVLVHEQATGDVIRQWMPESSERIVTVRPMFPMEEFEQELDPGAIKARYQVGPVDPTILYVGDLDERYGPDLLVKAMPVLLRNNKQVRLIVVGQGTQFWPLRVYTRYLLLEHAVRLVGSVEGAPMCELMQAADVVVVPSREPTPWWPILAAWAARRPVVATHDAAPGLLVHEQDSVLCYANINSCVWGAERVLFDPDCAALIGRQGRRKLEDRFGWNAVAAQVEELLGVAQAARA
jgi:glycosyltransferase involved in cell wall biosynthesis